MKNKKTENICFTIIILFIAVLSYKICGILKEYKETHKNTKTNTILFRH